MRPALQTSLVLLMLLLSACDLKLKQAKTPPPPQPTVAKAEPPPAPASNEPLSIPQTQVRLPEPQPVAPEADVPPPPPAPSEVTPRRPKKQNAHLAPQPASPAPAKPEQAEAVETPAATDLPPRHIESALTEDQRRQRIEEISNRLHEVAQILSRVTARGLNDAQKRAAARISNFAARAYKAEDQGDIPTASGLADRALLLAQDLDRAK